MKNAVDAIYMEGLKCGDAEFQEFSEFGQTKHEYVINFTHTSNFSVDALQEAIEENYYVGYTYITDPEEDAHNKQEWALYTQFGVTPNYTSTTDSDIDQT